MLVRHVRVAPTECEWVWHVTCSFIESMSITPVQVVVGFDFSHSGRAALERSIALATRAPAHVLHFACVIDPHTPFVAVPTTESIDYQYAELVQRAVTAEVEAMLRAASVTDQVHFSVHARIGKPAVEILSVARDVGADLIIVGTKGSTGVERWFLGSVAEAIVREAGCTVEVARPKTYDQVDLLKIVEVEPNLTHVPPHHYSYAENNLSTLRAYWPGWY